jgi:hypothetical protein
LERPLTWLSLAWLCGCGSNTPGMVGVAGRAAEMGGSAASAAILYASMWEQGVWAMKVPE